MKQLTKEAFKLRGEFISNYPLNDVIPLLEDDSSRGLINAMCQLMADSGCRAGENPASSSQLLKEGGKNK